MRAAERWRCSGERPRRRWWRPPATFPPSPTTPPRCAFPGHPPSAFLQPRFPRSTTASCSRSVQIRRSRNDGGWLA